MIVRRGKLISRTALWASHIVVISWTGNTGPPTTPHLVHEVHHTTHSQLPPSSSKLPTAAVRSAQLRPLTSILLFSFCFPLPKVNSSEIFVVHSSTLLCSAVYPSTRLAPLLGPEILTSVSIIFYSTDWRGWRKRPVAGIELQAHRSLLAR